MLLHALILVKMIGSEYPRYLTKTSKRFNPIELAEITRKIVCKTCSDGAEARKYTDFYVVWVYQGIATGYVVGCNLRCVFCWSDFSRDYPELYGEFYRPDEVAEKLRRLCVEEGVERARISGGEPTICLDHLVQVVEEVEHIPEIETFLLETNGILLGYDESYVKKLAQFKKLIVRVSLKAGTPEEFSRRTGALPEFHELQFRAIRNLLKHGITTYVAAVTDPRLVKPEERREIFRKTSEIDPVLAQILEEETIDPYETSLMRLEAAGIDLSQ